MVYYKLCERKREAKPDGPRRWQIAPVGPDARTAEAFHRLVSEVQSAHNESLYVQRSRCVAGDMGACGSFTRQQVALQKPCRHPGESPEPMNRGCHGQSTEPWIQPCSAPYPCVVLCLSLARSEPPLLYLQDGHEDVGIIELLEADKAFAIID